MSCSGRRPWNRSRGLQAPVGGILAADWRGYGNAHPRFVSDHHQYHILRDGVRKNFLCMDAFRNGKPVRQFCSCAILSSLRLHPYLLYVHSIALAHQLVVPSLTDNLGPAAIEVRHRLMWACFCIDTAITQNSPQLAQFPLEVVSGIPLPANERRFLLRQPAQTRTLRFPWVPPTEEYVQEEGMPAQNVIVFALCQQVVRSASLIRNGSCGEALSLNVLSILPSCHLFHFCKYLGIARALRRRSHGHPVPPFKRLMQICWPGGWD